MKRKSASPLLAQIMLLLFAIGIGVIIFNFYGSEIKSLVEKTLNKIKIGNEEIVCKMEELSKIDIRKIIVYSEGRIKKEQKNFLDENNQSTLAVNMSFFNVSDSPQYAYIKLPKDAEIISASFKVTNNAG